MVAAGAIRGADSGTAGARYLVEFPGVVSVLTVVVVPELVSVFRLAAPDAFVPCAGDRVPPVAGGADVQ